jgi:hypothetical protein
MKTYLLVFSLLLSVTLFAQTPDAEPEFKHDIGINTFIVLNGILESSQTPFSLMYKTYTSPNKATRLGIDLNVALSSSKREQDFNNRDQRQDYVNVSLVIGREFQRNIAKKWIVYYGGDLVPYYGFNSITREEDGRETYNNDSRTYSLNARPFLGIRVNVAPMLYLSVEASAYLGYSYSKTSETSYNAPVTESEDRHQGVSLGTNRVTGIYLYYRF